VISVTLCAPDWRQVRQTLTTESVSGLYGPRVGVLMLEPLHERWKQPL
jgi:hypothetical protein